MSINLPEPTDDDGVIYFPTGAYPPVVIDTRTPGPDGPEYWVPRLLRQLERRRDQLDLWQRYYDGKQPLSFASEKFREAFGTRFGIRHGRVFGSNFMSLVVDATRERLEVQGFRFDDQEGDDDLWGIWQANDMDGQSVIAHGEALKKGVVYTLIEPAMGDEEFPRITIEDACHAIVEHDPRTRTRVAGLKRWLDDRGHYIVVLYLPDYVYKYRSDKPAAKSISERDSVYTAVDITQLRLEPWIIDGEDWPLRNGTGVVPLVPLLNRPDINGDGFSEVDPVMSNQDAINKYRADALVASEFAAFRQRWATGLEIPIDPNTGNPIEPFRAAVDRLWVVPPPDPDDPVERPETKFGEFEATDLGPYREMIEEEVGHVASITRTPYHYLIGQPTSVPPSGESLKSSEAGLVAKVKTASIYIGEGWEETMRVCLRAMGDPRADIRTAETIWKDPETRNDASTADSVQKLYQQGVIDDELAWQMLGLSPTQIKRLRVRIAAKRAEEDAKKAEAARQAAQAAASIAAAQPSGGNIPSDNPTSEGTTT
jgi:hypothetical protein